MAKKNLIIYCNPNNKSLNHSILSSVKDSLEKENEEVIVVDLYKENFSPILNSKDIVAGYQGMYLKDVQKYQLLIKNCDNIIFIFPIWWYQMPGILKGWIDRVFAYNFAYIFKDNINIGLLKNKTCSFIMTMGNILSNQLKAHFYKTFSEAITEFCGLKTNTFYLIDQVNMKKQKEIAVSIDEIKTIVKNHEI